MAQQKILVIDDSSTVRELVATTLGKAGYTVIEACDGVDGLDQIGKNEDLSAVICDVNMPRMSGIDMIESVHKEGSRPTLPILMLTTEGQRELIQRAKQSGAKGWIIKPFVPEMLLAAVRKVTAA
jgi:two-component system chemotaxis response regulator CheY